MSAENICVSDTTVKPRKDMYLFEYEAVNEAVLNGMGLNQTQVFCSSLPGYGIPIDTNIFDYLRKLFSEHDLHVIFVHSENYYKSSVSLNEM